MSTTEPTTFSTAILGALQSKPVYKGTVTRKDKLARRKANRRSKVSRRTNR